MNSERGKIIDQVASVLGAGVEPTKVAESIRSLTSDNQWRKLAAAFEEERKIVGALAPEFAKAAEHRNLVLLMAVSRDLPRARSAHEQELERIKAQHRAQLEKIKAQSHRGYVDFQALGIAFL